MKRKVIIGIVSALVVVACAVVVLVLASGNKKKTPEERKGNNSELPVVENITVTENVTGTPTIPTQTPTPIPTTSPLDNVVEAGKGRFAEMTGLLTGSEQYTMTLSYSYDIGDGERVDVSQNYELYGDYWYCQNKCAFSDGEILDDNAFLYDLEKNIMFDVNEEVAVQMNGDAVRIGGAFADIFYCIQNNKESLELIETYSENREGVEMTVEVYCLKDETSDLSTNGAGVSSSTANAYTQSNVVMNAEMTGEAWHTLRDEVVQTENQDYKFRVYYDYRGELIGFDNGKIFFTVQIKFVNPLESKKVIEATTQYTSKTFEEYCVFKGAYGAANAHIEEKQEDRTTEEEIIKRFQITQEKYRQVVLEGNKADSSYRNYLEDCFTPEIIDKIGKGDYSSLDEIPGDDSWSSWCYVGATGFWSIKKNTENDYSLYVAIKSSGMFYSQQHMKEIHCRYDGKNWIFDGYLPAEVVRLKKADKTSYVYWMAKEKTIEQILSGDCFINEVNGYHHYDTTKYPEIWAMDGIAFNGEEVKLKLSDSSIASEDWGEGAEYQYYCQGWFKTLVNKLGKTSKIDDSVYFIEFANQWKNYKESNYESVEYGMEVAAHYNWTWQEAELPSQSYMLAFRAGISIEDYKETLTKYGLSLSDGGVYDYWEDDGSISWGNVNCLSNTTVIPVDTLVVVFDNKIIDVIHDTTEMSYPDTVYNVDFEGDKDKVLEDSKYVVTEGNGFTVPFYKAMFYADSDSYDSELALLGGVLSSAAYSKGEEQRGERIYNVYLALGFEPENISLFSYTGHKNNETNVPGVKTNDDDIAFSIASMYYEDYHFGDGYYVNSENRYLVIITVRGSELPDDFGERAEAFFRGSIGIDQLGAGDYIQDADCRLLMWQNVPTHTGFKTAMNDVALGLIYYLNKHKEISEAVNQGRVDFFVTGHSLGGSVTNLLCATVLNKLRDAGNRVFGYCFAPPKTIRTIDGLKMDGCDNIWNVIVREDILPMQLIEFLSGYNEYPSVWGRYGIDRYVVCSEEYLPSGLLDFKAHSCINYIKGVLSASWKVEISNSRQGFWAERLVEIEKYVGNYNQEEWLLETKEAYNYDNNGRLKERWITSLSGEVIEWETLEYNQDGQLTKTVQTNHYYALRELDLDMCFPAGISMASTVNTYYDEHGRIERITTDDMEIGGDGFVVDISYDDDGRGGVITWADYGRYGSNINFTLDANGHVTKCTYFTASGRATEIKTTEYDDAGRCVAKRTYVEPPEGGWDLDVSNMVLYKEQLYTYNEHGDLIYESSWSEEEGKTERSYTITYYPNGNKETVHTYDEDSESSETWCYDEDGKLVCEYGCADTIYAWETEYFYGNGGRLEKETHAAWIADFDDNGNELHDYNEMSETNYYYQ